MHFRWFGIRMAARNVLRQRGRSASAVASVTFGIVSLLLASGFIQSILVGMREATITSQLGHIQVTRPAPAEGDAVGSLDDLLPHDSPLLDAIAGWPGVRLVGKRIRFSGLLSRGENTTSYVGEGVEPDKESALSASLRISAGSNLSPADPRGIIVGAGLAASLGVQVGDPVVLMANTSSGGINAVECRVRGIFTTVSKAYDDVAIRIPLSTANDLLKVAGAHAWVLLLDRTDDTPAALGAMKERFAGQRVEFTPWYSLADMYNKTSALFTKQVNVVKFIVAAIIVLAITNTMVMIVMERTGEIGTSLALGVSRSGVLQMFLFEGLLLGLAGGACGLLLGTALAVLISHFGIPMPPPPGMAMGYIARIDLSAAIARDATFTALATALLASLYPAWKASRLAIVDSLRQNR